MTTTQNIKTKALPCGHSDHWCTQTVCRVATAFAGVVPCGHPNSDHWCTANVCKAPKS